MSTLLAGVIAPPPSVSWGSYTDFVSVHFATFSLAAAITILMMKKIGHPSHFAGAVEAVASTGEVLMPPVMGAVAFIMAELTGNTNITVAIAAILPAILYYACLYFQIDLEAIKLGLVGSPRKELPSLKNTFIKGWNTYTMKGGK